MDLTATIAPKSDQINAEDLIAGPRTFTIDRVAAGSDEQPVNVHLVELPGRPYRPSKSMRRVMVSAWGKEAGEYAGRRLTLYRDPKVKFGGDVVGGIKISHLSHIEKRLSLALTVTRGKRSAHVVDPLPDVAPTAPREPSEQEVEACTDTDVLRRMWQTSGPERKAQIETRVAELNTHAAAVPDDAPDGNADS